MNASTTDLQPLVGEVYTALADLLETLPDEAWNSPSLCAGWRVREVIAHVTMPARLSMEEFGAEMAAADGDFTVLSNTVAARDAGLPREQHLANLRSPLLHAWEPPGGGASGALSHAVIHALDVTGALGLPNVAPDDATRAVLDDIARGGYRHFGTNLDGIHLRAKDLDWQWGSGRTVTADAGELISLTTGRIQ